MNLLQGISGQSTILSSSSRILNKGQGFAILSSVMTFSTGILLTAARIFEPLFRYIIVKKYYEYWGELYESKDGTSEEEK